VLSLINVSSVGCVNSIVSNLSSEERQALDALTKKGRVAASKVLKARALLLADESPEGKGWKDPQIMEATGIKSVTLARLKQRCCEVGPLKALERKRRTTRPREPVLDGESEANLGLYPSIQD
jgi:hypothetical protein